MIAELAAFTLLCEGMADAVVTDHAQMTVSDGFNTNNATASSSRMERVQDRVWIEINGTEARIRPPHSIAPAMTSRANGDWRPVLDLAVTEGEISGGFAFNWLNKPSFTVSRTTGEIVIRGRNPLLAATGFSGQCRPVETNERLF